MEGSFPSTAILEARNEKFLRINPTWEARSTTDRNKGVWVCGFRVLESGFPSAS